MPEEKSKFYAVFEANVETRYSRLILCSDYAQLQMFLDNLDESKSKISIIEVDDVYALSEMPGFKEELNEDGEDTNDFPQCYLN